MSPLAKRLRRTKAAVIDKLRGRRRRSSVARGRGRGRRAAGGGGGHEAELAGTTDALWAAVNSMQAYSASRTTTEGCRMQCDNMVAMLAPADRAAFARLPLAHLMFDNE